MARKVHPEGISHDPDRFEVITFIAKTMDGKKDFHETYIIIRENGKITKYEFMAITKVETSKLT